MTRTSRRLKEKKQNQRPATKYTSLITVATLDLDEYDSSLGPYLQERLKKVFDDIDVNISFYEVCISFVARERNCSSPHCSLCPITLF